MSATALRASNRLKIQNKKICMVFIGKASSRVYQSGRENRQQGFFRPTVFSSLLKIAQPFMAG
jgi:hypothetical protein